MQIQVTCSVCGVEKSITPARAKTFRFCSNACAGIWRRTSFKGEGHPRWTGGPRIRVCEGCGSKYGMRDGQPVTTFRKQKFCSKECADRHGFRFSGPDHYKWSGNPRRKHRGQKHHAWSTAVISRDGGICQECGASGVEVHAHHVKSYKDHPELRWDIQNGVTLCFKCHWNVHTGTDANGVNSGEPASGKAGGNPEPSLGGNTEEGLTTRGRAYRRWSGNCHECGAFISKRLSDVIGKSAIFCNLACRGKWTSKWKAGAPRNAMAVISSTSAPPETGDIV